MFKMNIVITDHAKEKLNNFNLPVSVLKNVIEKRKGLLFYDSKESTFLLKYNKLCVVIDKNENILKAVTVYRDNSQYRYRKYKRFKKISSFSYE